MAELGIANNNSYMRKHIKIFLLAVFVIFILSFLIASRINYTGENSAFLSGIITAWVTINPLEVNVSAPTEVEINKVFKVEAKIINRGEEKIEKARGEIFLPPELILLQEDSIKEIGIIPGKKEKKISWSVRGEELGNYIVSVKVSGELEGKEVSAEDSTMVKVEESLRRLPWRWFQNFFRLFES